MAFSDIAKSDIFFFVSTIAVTMFTIIAVIIGVYLIKLIREVRFLARDLKFRYRLVQRFIKYIFKLTRRR